MKRNNKLVAKNKKARHDYFIEEVYEAGIVLTGTEIKSIRAGKVSIKESYAKIENGEMIVYGMNISPYEQGNIFNRDPLRERKLLTLDEQAIYTEAQRAADAIRRRAGINLPSRFPTC